MGIPQLRLLSSASETSEPCEPSEAFADRPAVRVARVDGKGRGVVATRAIAAGEVIERAPVVVIPVAHRADLERTVLDHYVYDWPNGALAVALGSGSIYNHSYAPNATYVKRVDDGELEYIALVNIADGDEILVNYNGDPDDRTPLWFDVVD